MPSWLAQGKFTFININKHHFTSVIQGWFYKTFEISLYRVSQKHLTFDMLHVASSDIRVLGHSVGTSWRLLLRRVSESSQNMGQRLYCCDTVGYTLRNSTFWGEEKFRKCLLYIPNSSRLSSSRRPNIDEFHKQSSPYSRNIRISSSSSLSTPSSSTTI
jgi:hypothetical protein